VAWTGRVAGHPARIHGIDHRLPSWTRAGHRTVAMATPPGACFAGAVPCCMVQVSSLRATARGRASWSSALPWSWMSRAGSQLQTTAWGSERAMRATAHWLFYHWALVPCTTRAKRGSHQPTIGTIAPSPWWPSLRTRTSRATRRYSLITGKVTGATEGYRTQSSSRCCL